MKTLDDLLEEKRLYTFDRLYDDLTILRWDIDHILVDALASYENRVNIYYHYTLDMINLSHTHLLNFRVNIKPKDGSRSINVRHITLTPYHSDYLPSSHVDIVYYNKILSIVEDQVGVSIDELTNNNFTYLDINENIT